MLLLLPPTTLLTSLLYIIELLFSFLPLNPHHHPYHYHSHSPTYLLVWYTTRSLPSLSLTHFRLLLFSQKLVSTTTYPWFYLCRSHSLISYVAFAAFALKRFFPIETINYSVFVCVYYHHHHLFHYHHSYLHHYHYHHHYRFFCLKNINKSQPNDTGRGRHRTRRGINPPTRWIPRVWWWWLSWWWWW